MDRKERLRTALDNDKFLVNQYKVEQIEKQPSMIRRMGREVMDKLKIRSEKSEKIRDREMMAVVLREYREEKERRRLEDEKAAAEKRALEEQEEKRLQEMREEEERRSLECDMSRARDYFEINKSRMFRSERAQEIIENDFRERLTTVDDLEEALLEEKEGISKRSIEYEDTEIPVYELTGLPFAVLSHAVDYRYANYSEGRVDIGNQTAQDLLKNPALWERTREEVEALPGYGTRNEDALGDVISTSYANSESNLNTRVSKLGDYYTLCYGFSHPQSDSVLFVTSGDGSTSNTGGKGKAIIRGEEYNAVRDLEGDGGVVMYNETVLRRYDENGKPILPDYIITENGHIAEAALRHAKYFGIPIVNINKAPYEKRLEEKAIEAIDSVNPGDSYDDVSKAVSMLKRAPRYYHEFQQIDSVGRACDSDGHEVQKKLVSGDRIREKIVSFEEIEFEARMRLIEDTLAEGRPENGRFPDGFEYFSVNEREPVGMYAAPGNCNRILVVFRRNGEAKNTSTTVFDGEHIFEPEKALALGHIEAKDLEKADSSYYERLKPLVDAYLGKTEQQVA